MAPMLEAKYGLEIEIISKPKAEYDSDEYFALDLPFAPAIRVGEKLVTEGNDIAKEKLEALIKKQIGL
ncbi:hypothetical protein KKA14_11805 [bacterium]|nr:hypothetical protein [bacterium]